MSKTDNSKTLFDSLQQSYGVECDIINWLYGKSDDELLNIRKFITVIMKLHKQTDSAITTERKQGRPKKYFDSETRRLEKNRQVREWRARVKSKPRSVGSPDGICALNDKSTLTPTP